MATAALDLETKVGLKPGQLHTPEFKDESVRAHALLEIGELDSPEALAYLQGLRPEDIQPDTSGQMRSAAQVALRHVQLNRLPDEPAKVQFLQDTTSERSAAAWWAVQELCNRGSSDSLGFIRQSISRTYPPPTSTDQIAFCEARIDIISRDPDRSKALLTILSVNSGVTVSQLLDWAINELRAVKSPQIEAELQRYADEIENLPDDSALKRELLGPRYQIRDSPPVFKPKPTKP